MENLKIEYIPIGNIKPYEKNARKHKDFDVDAIVKSIEEFGFDDPIGIWSDKNIIVEGHGRLMAAKKLGMTEVPCIRLDHLTDEQRRAYALAHNKTAENSEWDLEILPLELQDIVEIDMSQFGFDAENDGADFFDRENRFDSSREDGNDEYNDFLDKFEQKKTTDDCYTPENIYEVVVNYVTAEYGVSRNRFVRPFFPGGDYANHKYPEDCIVVDNPPFSILAEIVDFYVCNGVKFFLFAPGLSTIGYTNRENICAICTYAGVTYENGATVTTSFLTNLGDGVCCAKSAPELYKKIDAANDENLRKIRRQFPKYEYPVEVVTAAKLGYLSKYGQSLKIDRSRSMMIRQLDSQKEVDKGIFGSALLLSRGLAAEKAAAEKAAAEKAAAEKAATEKAATEKAAATVWPLSDRELEIIRTLTENDEMGGESDE